MALRRGFKTEANYYAKTFRHELRLEPHDPLCPWTLAKHLEIPVIPMSTFVEVDLGHLAYLRGPGSTTFSAATVMRGSRRLIVHNDSHSLQRQAANIAHELAHGILQHLPSPPLDQDGSRFFDKTIEDEAGWLGPALLVSEEAAIHIVATGMSTLQAVTVYRVSEDLLNMRIGVSGAKVRVHRQQAKWHG